MTERDFDPFSQFSQTDGQAMSRQCPNCGLQNPESFRLCECGYDFKEATVRPRVAPATDKTPPEVQTTAVKTWVKVAAILAFIQATFTVPTLMRYIFLEENTVKITATFGCEIVLFVGFGIAIWKKRLWGAFGLIALSIFEGFIKVYYAEAITGDQPFASGLRLAFYSLIWTAIYALGALSLVRSENLAPRLRELNWKVIVQFSFFVVGCFFLIGFVSYFHRVNPSCSL